MKHLPFSHLLKCQVCNTTEFLETVVDEIFISTYSPSVLQRGEVMFYDWAESELLHTAKVTFHLRWDYAFSPLHSVAGISLPGRPLPLWVSCRLCAAAWAELTLSLISSPLCLHSDQPSQDAFAWVILKCPVLQVTEVEPCYVDLSSRVYWHRGQLHSCSSIDGDFFCCLFAVNIFWRNLQVGGLSCGPGNLHFM